MQVLLNDNVLALLFNQTEISGNYVKHPKRENDANDAIT